MLQIDKGKMNEIQ